ncbi:MAG: hypothetical protein IH604_21410 [Burkholderiales bacterium]|nr:hypothetical protein [Burkholderiales bacterium]
MSITALIDANAAVIADGISALFTVAGVVVSVQVAMRGIQYVLEIVRGSRGGGGFGPDGDLSREEFDAIYPVDPADPDDWRNYDWNDDNDPQGHFHTVSERSYPEADWTMADLKFAADRGEAGAKAEYDRRAAG